MKNLNRKAICSLLLAVAMLLQMLPAVSLSAGASTYTWNDSAVMTLTGEFGEITPDAVIEEPDRKMKIYSIQGGSSYTLTTSENNDYGVLFKVYLSKDVNGEFDFDNNVADITLDNVTIRTKNPRHGINEGSVANNYAAMMFWGADLTINGSDSQNDVPVAIQLNCKGVNTIELLGTRNDTSTDTWSALCFSNSYAFLYSTVGGNGVLNASCSYADAVGDVAGIRQTGNLSIGRYEDEIVADAPTVNILSKVTGTDGSVYGNGIVGSDCSINIYDGSTVNITAGGIGIYRQHLNYTGIVSCEDSTLNISAGIAGIRLEGVHGNYYNYLYLTDSTVDIGGLTEGGVRQPVQAGIQCSYYIRIGNSTVTVNAVNEALDAAYDPEGNQSYSNKNACIRIENGAQVTVSGSQGEDEDVYAVDTEASYSSVYLVEGSKLNIRAKHMALCSTSTNISAGSELEISTTGAASSILGGTELVVCAAYDEFPDGKLTVDAASDRLGYRSLYIYSRDVWIKVAGTPFPPTNAAKVIAYNDIVLMESADGVRWQPFSQDNNSSDEIHYLTTRLSAQENHICANDVPNNWTKDETADVHHSNCLLCGGPVSMDCVYVFSHYYPTPTATSDGVKCYKCAVTGKNHYKDVIIPAHDCAAYCSDWDGSTNTVNHMAVCGYDNCGDTVYQAHQFTQWTPVDTLTVRRECTVCHRVETKNAHENVVHMEAVAGNCATPGRIEFWHCTDSDCGLYFADALMSQPISQADTVLTPGAHNYGSNGICTLCGEAKQTQSFIPYDENSYSRDGERNIFVGEANGQLYVMGNITNPDGSRNAVAVNARPNGVIDTDTATAEFFAYDTDEYTFCPDGGYMTILDGKIVVFDKARADESGMPDPIDFRKDSYYSDTGYLVIYPYSLECRYIVFDPETLTFKPSTEAVDSIMRYQQICSHPEENWSHNPPVAPTCIEQGVSEFWYCSLCENYYVDHDFEIPYNSDGGYINTSAFTLPATGHRFDAAGICEYCSLKRPVYTQISNIAQFDALDPEASYIIVFKDGEKTYAAALPPENPYWVDLNNDGEYDLFVVDENGNGVPDCIEAVDLDEDGTLDYLQDWNYDEEPGSIDDYWRIYESLGYAADEESYNALNFTEVTVAADGSITVTDEGAVEYLMMESGVWGGSPYFEEDFEYYEIDPETERIRAAWIPNYWFAASGQMGYYAPEHFMINGRSYGDKEAPGINDHKNWKISFREDGTACLVNSWTDLTDDCALQLAKYTDEEGNPAMSIVGLPEWLWEDSYIMQNRTALLPAYLYASQPVYSHIHTWSNWVADPESDTHTRTCSGCQKTQTEVHGWDNGTQTAVPTCTLPGTTTYTCAACAATREAEIPALDHDWSVWRYDSVDSHIRTCNRNCGVAQQSGGHEWGDWTPAGEETHEMVCSVCSGKQTGTHTFDEGVVTQAPTHLAMGEKTYTCADCGYTRMEEMPKLPEHEWTDWAPLDEQNHIRSCSCNESQSAPHSFDEGVVTQAPTHLAVGEKTYTCADCGYTRMEEIPKLPEHEWTDWAAIDSSTHSRSCRCGETETAPHDWTQWQTSDRGIHSRSCPTCQMEETIQVPADQPVNTSPSSNAAGANLANSDIELIDSVLTDEEQSQAATGSTVSVYLVVEDISHDVPAAEQAAIEAAAGEDEIGMYLDIDLYKKIDEEETQVTETNGKVTITIQVPEALLSGSEETTRVYKIIRVHDFGGSQQIETIEGIFDPVEKTFTFETDKFSTYALVYFDRQNAMVEAYNAASDTWLPYLTAEEAIAAGYNTLRLLYHVPSIRCDGDLYLDLAGYTANSVTVGGTLYCFDSSATKTAAGTGKLVTDSNLVRDYTAGGIRYIALAEENGYSFHVLEIRISGLSLRTSAAGIYYRAIVSCDPVLSAAIAQHGIALSLQNMPGTDFATESGDLNLYTSTPGAPVQGVEFTSGSVFNIFNPGLSTEENRQRGEIKIYANAYLQLTDGTVILSDNSTGDSADTSGFDGIGWSLRDVMEKLNRPEIFGALTQDEQQQVTAFCASWNQVIDTWATDNLKFRK